MKIGINFTYRVLICEMLQPRLTQKIMVVKMQKINFL
jgi:hypothetical protein